MTRAGTATPPSAADVMAVGRDVIAEVTDVPARSTADTMRPKVVAGASAISLSTNGSSFAGVDRLWPFVVGTALRCAAMMSVSIEATLSIERRDDGFRPRIF